MLTISQAENGRTFSVAVSEQFKVSLPENPTTGHRWFLSIGEKSGCELMEDVFEPSSNNQPGAGGTHRWKFKAVAASGDGVLEFANARSWEQESASAQRFSIRVKVSS